LEQVARLCGLPVDVVQRYHHLFFDVRDHLRAADWIMLRAVGTYFLKGFAGMPVGALWKYAAYTAGRHALELVEALTTDAPLPAWVGDGLAGGASAEARFRRLGELTIGALTADSHAEWEALIRARQQLQRADAEALGTPAEKSGLLATMEQFLMAASHREVPGRQAVVKPTEVRWSMWPTRASNRYFLLDIGFEMASPLTPCSPYPS
jgi:hypothetical protein